PDAGRHSDPGLVPYYDNINANKTAPNFTSADQPAGPYWIFDVQKKPFNDTYNTGDEIAGIIVRPPTVDRADIMGKAVYMDGNWTLEYGRKLMTGSQFDVQFSDMKKEYLFGTAVFDNAQTRHSYESGVSKFVFASAWG
ncbi:MAG TPA: ethylbenzene dehydrogenase-related protein, partial [Candidatus Methanoperedens sp.]|nr:ethylbenzene dehydrogenase-related protein [Candidatus Methanoperedens sp.]